jgi:hypothetical protein
MQLSARGVTGSAGTAATESAAAICGTTRLFRAGVTRFSLREMSILRSVWKLWPEEAKTLRLYFIKQTNARTFLDMLDTSHDYKDVLRIPGLQTTFNVSYHRCTLDGIDDGHDEKSFTNASLLLSFRVTPLREQCTVMVRIVNSSEPLDRVTLLSATGADMEGVDSMTISAADAEEE